MKLFSLAAILLNCGAIYAQSFELPNPFGAGGQGFRFYGATASFGYSSLGLPASNVSTSALSQVQDDYDGTGSLSVGYSRLGDRSNFSLNYTPSYTRRVHYAGLKSFQENLSLSYTRHLTPRLSWTIGASGADNSIDRYLFLPNVFTHVLNAPASFDNLVSAVIGGSFSNDQIASILTGAPILQSPAQSVVYGNRILSATLHNSLSYGYSTRLSITFNLSGSYSQNLTGSLPGANGTTSTSLLPRTISGSTGVGVSYLITPNVTITTQADTQRVHGGLNDYYIHNGSVSLGKKFGQRWFASIHGGGGTTTQVGQLSLSQSNQGQGPRYSAGASLGFRTHAQTFSGAINRSISDPFGLASRYSDNVQGSWRYQRPGSLWSLGVQGGYQRAIGGAQEFKSWTAGANLARALSRTTSVSFAYTYLDNFVNLMNSTTPYSALSRYAARVTVAWNPGGRMSTEAVSAPTGGSPSN